MMKISMRFMARGWKWS